jgi:hypothetical protein
MCAHVHVQNMHLHLAFGASWGCSMHVHNTTWQQVWRAQRLTWVVHHVAVHTVRSGM